MGDHSVNYCILKDAQKELESAKELILSQPNKALPIKAALQKIDFALAAIKAKRGVL